MHFKNSKALECAHLYIDLGLGAHGLQFMGFARNEECRVPSKEGTQPQATLRTKEKDPSTACFLGSPRGSISLANTGQ